MKAQIFSPLILGWLLSACSSSSSSPMKEQKLIRFQEHLGEYLQKSSPGKIITVRRDAGIGGLVSIDWTSEAVEVLDAEASEARDLKVAADNAIAYRLQQSLRLWRRGNILQISTPPISHLRSFVLLSEDRYRLTYDLSSTESGWILIDGEKGEIIKSGEISPATSVRAHWLDSENHERVILQSKEGLFSTEFSPETATLSNTLHPIATGEVGAYVTVRTIGEKTWIAFFNESKGILSLTTLDANESSVQTIDGEAGKTYRGQDIAIFNDGGKPGLLYLDAWALKLRWARQKKNKENEWTTEELPIPGAVGFYTQILSETDAEIQIAFHNFRTQHSDRSQSFEDLMMVWLRIGD